MTARPDPGRTVAEPREQPGAPTLEAAMGVLRELVRLKDLKDRAGETADYRRNKDAAWDAARTLLAHEPRPNVWGVLKKKLMM